jgi:hypothetical protein
VAPAPSRSTGPYVTIGLQNHAEAAHLDTKYMYAITLEVFDTAGLVGTDTVSITIRHTTG